MVGYNCPDGAYNSPTSNPKCNLLNNKAARKSMKTLYKRRVEQAEAQGNLLSLEALHQIKEEVKMEVMCRRLGNTSRESVFHNDQISYQHMSFEEGNMGQMGMA